MQNIKAYIHSHKQALDQYIADYFTTLIEKRRRISGSSIADLYTIFKNANEGGKCIRGSLVKLGYELAADRAIDEKIFPASAAFEILQTALLCHDDIIDKSPLRRGKPSIWQAITNSDTAKGDRHYGISQAICLGDIGFILADMLIEESDFDTDKKIEALQMLHRAELNTVDGEMLDVLVAQEKSYDDEDNILKISRLKTAWYTIIGPLQLGAVLGGASQELLDHMTEFGLSLGIAFQLRDDILGVQALEQETGKSDTSDISEGKVTLLIRHALKNASPEQLKTLRCLYGNPVASEDDRTKVLEVFEATGAFAEVSRKAECYLTEAVKVIPLMTKNEERTVLLTQLGEMMFQRKA